MTVIVLCYSKYIGSLVCRSVRFFLIFCLFNYFLSILIFRLWVVFEVLVNPDRVSLATANTAYEYVI